MQVRFNIKIHQARYLIYSGASEKRTLRDIASVPCREVVPISDVVLY